MLIWVINVCGSFDFFTSYPCWIRWYFYFKIEIHGTAFRELITSLLFYHIYSIFQDKTCFFAKFKAFLVPSLLVLMQTRVNYQGSSHYLIYCQNKPQTCFVELKGANISIKNNYNPYDQIMDTIKYLQSKDELKELVDKKGGKHAFIVSPSRQNIPKGSNTKERQLWKKLTWIIHGSVFDQITVPWVQKLILAVVTTLKLSAKRA